MEDRKCTGGDRKLGYDGRVLGSLLSLLTTGGTKDLFHLSLFPPFHVFQSTPVGGPYHIHFLSLKEVTKAVRLEEYQ